MAESDKNGLWRLALIAGDTQAIKVAAAFYALPRKQQRDLDKLADISGVTQGVAAILTRLDAAGMLHDGKDPPEVLVRLMNTFAAKHLTGK